MRLSGKVALITGAGVGIGRGTALLFAREGAAVVVVDLNEQTGNETVQMIEQKGGSAVFARADVSREQDVRNMFAQTIEFFRPTEYTV